MDCGVPANGGIDLPGVLKEIRKRFARREPLNISAVKRACPELMEPLYQPNAFIGWRKALEKAGVSYAEINVELGNVVECRLCGKEFACITSHLLAVHEYTTEDYRAEFPGTEVASESFRAQSFGVFCRRHADRKARTAVPHWEPLWSREYALDRLFYFYELGHSVHMHSFHKMEPTLPAYLRREFSGYDDALAAIGLNPLQVRRLAPPSRWNRKEILEAFRERLAAGQSLSQAAVQRENRGLVAAVFRHFGTYRAAIEALGIDYEREVKAVPLSTLPEQRREILEEARRLAAIPGYDWKAVEEFQNKYRAALQPCFRNWNSVAAQAGIPVERITFNSDHVLDREAALEGLRQRHRAGLSMRSACLAEDDRRLSFSVLKHFGKLTDALREAGITLDLSSSYPARYGDAQAVLDAIRERKAADKPVDNASLCKGPLKDKVLYRTARQFFGSWREAIVAAGLNPMEEFQLISTWERYPMAEDVLEAIRTRKQEGKSLRWADTHVGRSHGGDRTLLLVAQERFGSWHEALIAAGFDPHRESPLKDRKYGTVELVIEELQRRKREGRTLDCQTVCHGHVADGGDRPLYDGATKFFRTWKNAVAVATGS